MNINYVHYDRDNHIFAWTPEPFIQASEVPAEVPTEEAKTSIVKMLELITNRDGHNKEVTIESKVLAILNNKDCWRYTSYGYGTFSIPPESFYCDIYVKLSRTQCLKIADDNGIKYVYHCDEYNTFVYKPSQK
jgi:hypothetical protein